MSYLKAGDVISGQEGRSYTTINGEVELMFYIRNLEATIEKNKVEVRTLGRRGVQNKATGHSGTGSMEIFYVTSKFRQLMMKYTNEGIDTYFDITVTNEDPSSSIGRQTTTLRNVNLNSVIVASLNTESEVLTETVDFTFDGVDMPEMFGDPTLGE